MRGAGPVNRRRAARGESGIRLRPPQGRQPAGARAGFRRAHSGWYRSRGSAKKNTPYAAQTASEECAKTAFDLGLRKVKVYVKGPGNGRESAIRAIANVGIQVTEIVDVTPMPHNGCRPPKRRRV